MTKTNPEKGGMALWNVKAQYNGWKEIGPVCPTFPIFQTRITPHLVEMVPLSMFNNSLSSIEKHVHEHCLP